VCGREFLPYQVLTAAGFAVSLCGMVGMVIVTAALDACLTAQSLADIGARERLRLMLLGLVGTAVGLVGFVSLAGFGVLVMIVSPFKGFQVG
jgi:hypothetical protein